MRDSIGLEKIYICGLSIKLITEVNLSENNVSNSKQIILKLISIPFL